MVDVHNHNDRTRMNIRQRPGPGGGSGGGWTIGAHSAVIYVAVLLMIVTLVVEFTGYGPDTATDLLPN